MDKENLYKIHRLKDAEDKGLICVCKEVSDRKIKKAFKEGHTNYQRIKVVTEAGTSCGYCEPRIQKLINELKEQ
jgi:NAD(P)H-nitrite reductase large subunit